MTKHKVLFVRIHNSARSQMAEAWLNHLYGDGFEIGALSTPLKPKAATTRKWPKYAPCVTRSVPISNNGLQLPDNV
jgi:protein-tyrosine-phosphatase